MAVPSNRFPAPTVARRLSSRHSRRGAVAVFIAICAVLITVIVALSLDTAYVRMTGQELQAAADAAALSAVQQLDGDSAAAQYSVTRQKAVDTALANEAGGTGVRISNNLNNDPAGDVVVGVWDRVARTFTPSTNSPNAVRVVTRRTSGSADGPLGLFFGGAFGTATSEVSRVAIAQSGSGSEAVVIILDPTMEKALDQRGNAELHVPYNSIQVNSSHNCAMYMNGQPDIPRISAGEINVVGNYCIPIGSTTPTPTPNSPVLPDPLAALPQPTTSGMTDRGGITGPGTYFEGYYPLGIDFNNGVAFLNPGVYFIGGGGIDLTGDALLQGSEIMLFIDNGSEIRIAGNSPGMDIGAPTSGTYAGVSIFYDRANTSVCSISGGGLFDVRGTMYMKSGHLEMDGNVDRTIGRIIFNSQQLRGNGRYTITGEGVVPTGPRVPYLVH